MQSQVSILRHHVYTAVDLGADFRELCRRLNITPEYLTDGEALAPYDVGSPHEFWTHALALTGDPCLGLHMGMRPTKYHPFGMLGMMAGAARTVGEAIEVVSRYNETLSTVFKFDLDRSGSEAIFSFTPHPLWEEGNPESARQAVDMSISAWIRGLNDAALRKVYPVRTELKHPKRHADVYREVVKGPVLFNMPAHRMIFNKEDMDIELVGYDKSLYTAFETLLKEKQKNLETSKLVSAQVKKLLLSSFGGQNVHIDIVAASMFMTTRTLQRKLSAESKSYREIVTEVRRELVNSLVKTGRNNKTQIAQMLGYSDVSSLNKAVRERKAS